MTSLPPNQSGPAAVRRQHRPVRQWVFGGAVAVLFLAAAFLLRESSSLREPIIEGRPLRVWTAAKARGDAAEQEQATRILLAHREMVAPFLIRLLETGRDGPSLPERFVESLPTGWKRWFHRHWNPYQRVMDRADIARALGVMGPADDRGLAALTGGLADSQYRVQEACFEALWECGPAGVARLVESLAGLPSPLKWRAVARFEPGRPDLKVAGPALAAELGRLERAEDAPTLGQALARYGPDTLPMLFTALEEPDPALQENTIAALVAACRHDHTFWLAFIESLPSQTDPARRAGIEVLARVPEFPTRAGVALAARILDPDPSVRERAAELLLGHPGNRIHTVLRLIEALDSPEAEVRRLAARVLAGLGNAAEPALAALMRLETDPEPTVRDAAALAREEIGVAAKGPTKP